MNYEIEELLKEAFTNQASDLHITVDSPPIFRINGQLIKKGETILTDVETEQMAKHLLSNQQYEELVKVGELDFSYQLDHSHYRINLFKQQGHIGLVARVIPSHIPSIEELQLPDILRSIAL